MISAIDDRWQRGRLGDLLPLKYGKGLPEKSRDSSGSVPVFGSSGQVGRHSHPLTSGPTLIVGRKGTVGAVHLSPEPCWPIDTVYFAEPEEGQNLKYYKYLLDSLNLATLDRSTAIPGLSRDDYNAVEVTIAPPREQQRIVAELEKHFSRLDKAVANLKRVTTRLASYRERVLDEAFAPAPNTTLGEVIAAGPQNGLYLPKAAYGSGTPIVRIDDYQTDWIRPVAELRRVRASESQLLTWALQPADLLVNRVNSMSHLGKCIVVPDALAGALFESNMMRFRVVSGVLPRYVELYLGSRIGKQRLTANAKWAVNQASINQKDVQATEIPLPSPECQVQIVAEVHHRLSIVREVEAQVDANLKRAQALRQAVLGGAFAVASDAVPSRA